MNQLESASIQVKICDVSSVDTMAPGRPMPSTEIRMGGIWRWTPLA